MGKRLWTRWGFGSVLGVSLFDGLEIRLLIRVLELNIRIHSVPHFHDLVEIMVINLSLGEGEVAAKCNVYVINILLVVKLLLDDFPKMLHLLHVAIGVVLLGVMGIRWVKGDILFVVLVKTESFGPAVLVLLLFQDKGHNILLGSKVFGGWSPDLVVHTIFDHLSLLVKIKPRVKHGVEPKISSQSGESVRDTKGINLPTDVWHVFLLEFFFNESVAGHKIID